MAYIDLPPVFVAVRGHYCNGLDKAAAVRARSLRATTGGTNR